MVATVNFLLEFDSNSQNNNLCFENHINKLCGKINSRTKLMWHIRNLIPTSLAKTLYILPIHTHVVYCKFILVGVSEGLKDKLQVHQNSTLLGVWTMHMQSLDRGVRSELIVYV